MYFSAIKMGPNHNNSADNSISFQPKYSNGIQSSNIRPDITYEPTFEAYLLQLESRQSPSQPNPAKLRFGLRDQKLANQFIHVIEIQKYESIYIYSSYVVAPV
jgi:hypothetical protein